MKEMNYEKINELINNIVSNEFYHVQEENLHGMDNLEEYEKISEESEKIYRKLSEVLPQEYKYLVDELETKECDKLCFEIKHYFKKGVAAGTSNLNFLRDITSGMIFY